MRAEVGMVHEGGSHDDAERGDIYRLTGSEAEQGIRQTVTATWRSGKTRRRRKKITGI
jgi:hypothetical protein